MRNRAIFFSALIPTKQPGSRLRYPLTGDKKCRVSVRLLSWQYYSLLVTAVLLVMAVLPKPCLARDGAASKEITYTWTAVWYPLMGLGGVHLQEVSGHRRCPLAEATL